MSRADVASIDLKHIGRRKLLTAQQEQEIGRKMEVARGELLAALAAIPAARQTLLSLADAVRHQAVPAVELILLPDGGELKPEKIDVERAMDPLKRARAGGVHSRSLYCNAPARKRRAVVFHISAFSLVRPSPRDRGDRLEAGQRLLAHRALAATCAPPRRPHG